MKFNTLFKIVSYKISHKPKILSKKRTIKYIIKNNLSITRFGDGELNLMLGDEMLFDKNNDSNKYLMLEAFNARNNKLLICLTSAINPNLFKYTYNSYIYSLNYFLGKREQISKLLDYKYKYGDACISRFYMSSNFKCLKNFKKYIKLLQKIWNDRDILFVEGTESKLGIGCDLFNNASSIRRIVCPNKNCLDIIEKIEQTIIKNAKDSQLIILALGPAATYLSYKLSTKYNYQALDLGHIDIEYIWWKNRVKEKTSIQGKHAAEAHTHNTIELDLNLPKYESEIIAKVN